MKRKNFKTAFRLTQEYMKLNKPNTKEYLRSLEVYINCSLQGRLLPDEQLLTLISDGLTLAKDLKEPLFVTLLTLLEYLIKDQVDQYYHYLDSQALPLFKRNGYVFYIQQYEKELFNYYMKIGNTVKAVEIANALINKD